MTISRAVIAPLTAAFLIVNPLTAMASNDITIENIDDNQITESIPVPVNRDGTVVGSVPLPLNRDGTVIGFAKAPKTNIEEPQTQKTEIAEINEIKEPEIKVGKFYPSEKLVQFIKDRNETPIMNLEYIDPKNKRQNYSLILSANEDTWSLISHKIGFYSVYMTGTDLEFISERDFKYQKVSSSQSRSSKFNELMTNYRESPFLIGLDDEGRLIDMTLENAKAPKDKNHNIGWSIIATTANGATTVMTDGTHSEIIDGAFENNFGLWHSDSDIDAPENNKQPDQGEMFLSQL